MIVLKMWTIPIYTDLCEKHIYIFVVYTEMEEHHFLKTCIMNLQF